jgi:hypothetical protein
MKRLTILLLLGALIASAEDITLTKAALLKADRSAVSLKAGTVVELISRDENTLTIRYHKLTGTIPASSVGDAPAAEAPKKEEPKKEESKTAAKPEEKPDAPARKATTMYGKAVEKAKENAGQHEKNVVKPADEILGK